MQIGSLVAFSLSLYYLALFETEQTCLCFFVNSTPLRFVQIFRMESIANHTSLNFLRLGAVLDGVAGSLVASTTDLSGRRAIISAPLLSSLLKKEQSMFNLI